MIHTAKSKALESEEQNPGIRLSEVLMQELPLSV